MRRTGKCFAQGAAGQPARAAMEIPKPAQPEPNLWIPAFAGMTYLLGNAGIPPASPCFVGAAPGAGGRRLLGKNLPS